MRVSLILPCRNEARYIGPCLDSLLATAYPIDQLELLIVDGRSTDATREIAARYVAAHPWMRLLDNPRRVVPTGLNLGILASTGDIVARVDAHALYPPDYLPRLVAALVETGADNVGGRVITLPSEDTPGAQAIALALAHPFGVGDSYFRIGTTTRRWVDTVPYGCYRREVFRRIGLFDEELVRDQDEEFNYRLGGRGGRVLLLPEVTSYYFTRGSVRQMMRMIYQYGYFKPLVARKVGRVATLRQLAPPAFVLGLVAGTLFGFAWPPLLLAVTGTLWLYAALLLLVAFRAARTHNGRCALALVGVIPALHLAYGYGFLRGVWSIVTDRPGRWSDPAAISLTR